MGYYRKKPVVIEAKQFKGDVENILEILNWIADFHKLIGKPVARFEGGVLIIPTLEGDMTAQIGDWIIKGVQNEFYPCKPDIFNNTYEEVSA